MRYAHVILSGRCWCGFGIGLLKEEEQSILKQIAKRSAVRMVQSKQLPVPVE